MKKTIIKCAAFSVSLFVIINIVSTLEYFRILSDFWMTALQIFLLVAALPAYYFVKRDEEKLFVYPLVMTVSAVLNFVLSFVVYIALPESILSGWQSAVYFVGWFFIACYFVIILVIDFIIALAARIKEHKKG